MSDETVLSVSVPSASAHFGPFTLSFRGFLVKSGRSFVGIFSFNGSVSRLSVRSVESKILKIVQFLLVVTS